MLQWRQRSCLSIGMRVKMHKKFTAEYLLLSLFVVMSFSGGSWATEEAQTPPRAQIIDGKCVVEPLWAPYSSTDYNRDFGAGRAAHPYTPLERQGILPLQNTDESLEGEPLVVLHVADCRTEVI